ncbi:MAG: glycosyltransferase family A protein [Pseudonocardiaceae bacterium]
MDSDSAMTVAGRRPPLVEIPCRHLGGEAAHSHPQSGAGHPGSRRVRLCEVHGECTVHRERSGVACCASCESHAPETATLVAPAGTAGRPGQWMGRLPRRPWEFAVTAAIPHIMTPEPLAAAIATLRWQSVRPYIIVVDTGSTPEVCQQIEAMRCEDTEIHFIRSASYRHPSEPVAVALDLAHSLCHTERLYHTHSDCFIRRRDWLEWLAARCDADTPVVGYEMSERSGHDEWRRTVSHTATMLHMPTMRRIGASWNMQSWYEARGVPVGVLGTWPDTESMLRVCLDRAGITPLLINGDTCPGALHERNFTRDVDCNVDHVRSYPSRQLYRGMAGETAEGEMPAAIAEAHARAADWAHCQDQTEPAGAMPAQSQFIRKGL